MEHYNVIVVGAGSAGIPLATRLSENPHRTVLLLDAGPHYKTMAEYPLELRHGGLLRHVDPAHPNNWAFAAELTTQGARQIVPRGKVVGGSSAINGTVFERGLPEDFNEWAQKGNDQWSFDKVLPYFKKLETDQDIVNEWHGTDGPIPVYRLKPKEWAPVNHAFVEACLQAGYPADPDMNAPTSYGVGALALNNINGIRMNTAHTYLEPILDTRSNLTLRSDCLVRKVVFSGRKAIGVEAEYNGETVIFHGDEIVLSGGAVKSPHILMMSGVGPAAQLKKFDIPVVYDNPYVGQNFTDHCQGGGVKYSVKKDQKFEPTKYPGLHVGMHYTAEGSPYHSDMFSHAPSYSTDAQMFYKTSLFGRARMGLNVLRTMSLKQVMDQARFGRQLSITVALMKHSARGEMTLTSADSHDKPRLQYHYLENPFDMQRLRYGFRLISSLVDSEPYRKLGAERLSPNNEELESDSALDKYIQGHVGTSIHMASSCRMGPNSDDTAVVDQYCRVRGVDALRVVDTSIWPEVVRRCTNATAIMTGERAVEFFD